MLNSQTLKDFSKIAQGAFSTFGSLKNEIDIIVNSRLEKILVSKGLVSREEFDVAISRIDELKMEIDALKVKIEKNSKIRKQK